MRRAMETDTVTGPDHSFSSHSTHSLSTCYHSTTSPRRVFNKSTSRTLTASRSHSAPWDLTTRMASGNHRCCCWTRKRWNSTSSRERRGRRRTVAVEGHGRPRGLATVRRLPRSSISDFGLTGSIQTRHSIHSRDPRLHCPPLQRIADPRPSTREHDFFIQPGPSTANTSIRTRTNHCANNHIRTAAHPASTD